MRLLYSGLVAFLKNCSPFLRISFCIRTYPRARPITNGVHRSICLSPVYIIYDSMLWLYTDNWSRHYIKYYSASLLVIWGNLTICICWVSFLNPTHIINWNNYNIKSTNQTPLSHRNYRTQARLPPRRKFHRRPHRRILLSTHPPIRWST